MTVFPKGKHDDQVDSTAQFLDWFKKPFPSQGHYEYMRQRAQELQQRDKPQPAKTVWAIGSMGMARRVKGSGLNRGVRCGAPIPRSPPCDKGDKMVSRQDADRVRRHIDGPRRPRSVPAPARRHRPQIRPRSNDTGGSEAADAAADHRDPERCGQWLFVACQCASASCGFEIAGSMMSPCLPVLRFGRTAHGLLSK